ncbi:unnamed protein product [Penicillium salamii]|uniref:F-box domain-containing protein n=1 Tax=Penicillium salamii TaxID=1612424 RepID=A0A9W4N953_9EURO|nr:unnamed protein product [Penicillium salamii]CAG8193999.1 unnamed protein product [Penicillium salamii]CAG8202925.1 unnamed protein product [Penicillium salamii]CAG8207618.1 unnamed protein product [Penicillium salamii]CAG8327980.1 unnamed protein product [Penicillium salamii]
MTTLAELAPELLLIISDFLPLVDLCCFSVCNRRHYCLLSWKINPRLPLTPTQKLLLSTRLAQDTPSYFACTRCNLLHRYDGSESFGLSGYARERTCRLPCVQTWFSSTGTLAFHRLDALCVKELSFLHLYLAMRRFYHGPECGISTDSLSHTQVFEHRVRATANKVTWLFSRDAQICTEPLGLYLRLQDILLSPEWCDLISMVYDGNVNPLATCAHRDKEVLQAVTPELWSLENKEKNITKADGFIVSCCVCNTVCEIDLYEIDGKKAIVMTRWFNLGPGLDETDMIWKTKTNSSYEVIAYLGFDQDYPVEQCPKTRFEETAPQSYENLLFHNLSYLRDKQYELVMRYAWERKTWFDPFREPSNDKIVNFGRSLQAFFGWFPNPAFN